MKAVPRHGIWEIEKINFHVFEWWRKSEKTILTANAPMVFIYQVSNLGECGMAQPLHWAKILCRYSVAYLIRGHQPSFGDKVIPTRHHVSIEI